MRTAGDYEALNRRLRAAIMDLLRSDGPKTTAELCWIFGVSEKVIMFRMQELRDRGDVRAWEGKWLRGPWE